MDRIWEEDTLQPTTQCPSTSQSDPTGDPSRLQAPLALHVLLAQHLTWGSHFPRSLSGSKSFCSYRAFQNDQMFLYVTFVS